MDLAAAPGTAVLAAGAGMVGYAGVLAGRGVVTVVHPDGRRTTYEPLRVLVRPGQRVSPGTVLGILAPGHPGCPRRACLHWGLIDGSVYLDPLSLLRHGPVRLLPLSRARPDDGGFPARRNDGAIVMPDPGPTGRRGPEQPGPEPGRADARRTTLASVSAAPLGSSGAWPGTGSPGPPGGGAPWADPGTLAALGLAVAGALALSRRRPP